MTDDDGVDDEKRTIAPEAAAVIVRENEDGTLGLAILFPESAGNVFADPESASLPTRCAMWMFEQLTNELGKDPSNVEEGEDD